MKCLKNYFLSLILIVPYQAVAMDDSPFSGLGLGDEPVFTGPLLQFSPASSTPPGSIPPADGSAGGFLDSLSASDGSQGDYHPTEYREEENIVTLGDVRKLMEEQHSKFLAQNAGQLKNFLEDVRRELRLHNRIVVTRFDCMFGEISEKLGGSDSSSGEEKDDALYVSSINLGRTSGNTISKRLIQVKREVHQGSGIGRVARSAVGARLSSRKLVAMKKNRKGRLKAITNKKE